MYDFCTECYIYDIKFICMGIAYTYVVFPVLTRISNFYSDYQKKIPYSLYLIMIEPAPAL